MRGVGGDVTVIMFAYGEGEVRDGDVFAIPSAGFAYGWGPPNYEQEAGRIARPDTYGITAATIDITEDGRRFFKNMFRWARKARRAKWRRERGACGVATVIARLWRDGRVADGVVPERMLSSRRRRALGVG